MATFIYCHLVDLNHYTCSYATVLLVETSLLKAKLFYNLGRSVRTSETDSFFINLGMLELSYRFQTLYGIPIVVRYDLESKATL